MNFKERGVTVGDLVILLIVIIFSFFIVDKIKESKTQKQITNLYQLEIQKILVNKYFCNLRVQGSLICF